MAQKRSVYTSFIILDAQSVKNTDPAESSGYDGGYTGNNFAQSVQAMINAEVIIAKQSDLRHGQVTPQRWVIERSFSWLGKHRRLWRNRERKLNTSKMIISLAFLRILLKRF
ncbi:transposase [Oenococcus oeni]|uniref:transposase n=1 Tax=Oenococcus oeni TaxID=1247 RepID=UPI0008F84A3D|nr:transposase [Oenococcus oeni]OIM22369.1 transposase [Oenococcus oeni]